ncbi:DUF1456 family protein [Bacillus sp. AGMB 02131]|uniref:DUF1456 family protein n=1 Tax=Peribacillus faecalis TaxID=2772559 RepID=A0A927HAG6_9BACI|nr:DUF1456 family protein [Peribacillus faecalis]MBD3107904.1 DUF1456 family protein [Peribacillus faecalis]
MDMNNNDILIRLRYALNIKDEEMVEIFKLGDIDVSLDDVTRLLKKTNEFYEDEIDEDAIYCDNFMLESFLNGLIIYKRGRQEPKPGQPAKAPMMMKNARSVNNVLLKKVKIALALTSDDVMDILEEVGVIVSKGELTAIFRKEGHKHYMECGDRYARNFLKGLALRYRD